MSSILKRNSIWYSLRLNIFWWFHIRTLHIYWITFQSGLTFASSVGGLVELGGLYQIGFISLKNFSLNPRETLVSWQLAPITWRAVCPPWWLVVVHVRVVPGGINDLLAISCERIRTNDGQSNWKILFLNALHWCFFVTQHWCCGGRCRTCCRGARRRTAWFSPGTIVFRFSGWSGAWSSSGKVFLKFLFLARQSISIRMLIHLFGNSLLISQNGQSGPVGQGVQCGQSLV